MKKLSFYLFLLSMLSFGFIACSDDDNDPMFEEPTQNIVELAQVNGFSSLAAALTKAGLVEALQADSDFTVFAPTNEAFDALLTAIGQTSIDDVPAPVLEQILLYHVVSGVVKSSDVQAGDVTTLEGTNISLTTANGIKVNGVSVVSPFDVEATNGVIHTIDQVLVPASIGQFVNTVLAPAYFNESFTTLVAAVSQAELVEALLTTPNLTIFAPTNDAFADAGIDLSSIDKESLTKVLTYHVVGQKVLSSEIPREAQTLNENMIYFTIEGGAFINGNTEITGVDIESGSGVVHVIDSVLFPPSGNIVETAIELSNSGEFTSLVAALLRTMNEGTEDQNLVNALSGEGPFTVFAPTNEAFQAVLDSNPEWSSLNDIPLSTLIAVLTYHVVPARAFDKDLPSSISSESELPTVNGQNIAINLENLMINESSKITSTNVNATNGVIHVIDSVLLPM